jgi:phosphohistidine phosphatase
MKRILLIRHSIAEHGSNDRTDEERNLTEQGIQLTKSQAIKLQQIQIYPDKIVSSHAVRAITTAELLAEQLTFMDAISIEPFLYRDFATQEFINYVHKIPNSIETIVFVGHNPTISALLHWLTAKNSFSFSPAAIGIISIGFENWNSTMVGKCKLEQFLIP